MTDTPIEGHCARCLKPTPPPGDPQLVDWEGVDGKGGMIICPDCIQPEELY